MSGQSSFKMGMSTKVGNIVNKKINKNKNPPIVNKMGGEMWKMLRDVNRYRAAVVPQDRERRDGNQMRPDGRRNKLKIY